MSLNHHYYPADATATIDAAFRAKPAEGSMDATAWGEPQHRKAVQEITRIRKARLTLDSEIYRPTPPYFPTPVQYHIPRHQGFGGHPWAY